MSALETAVLEIAEEMRARPIAARSRPTFRSSPASIPRRSASAVIDAAGNVAAAGDGEAVLDPEHLQGVHADAGARQGRRQAVAAGRPRAVGQPFNSIVQLENEHGIPRNPFINAGAIAVTD